MARVTVEDCIEKVPNKFELVCLATERAKRIFGGRPPEVPKDNDKYSVIALREIAAGLVDIDNLRDEQIKRLQKNNRLDSGSKENLYAEKKEYIPDIDYSGEDIFSDDVDKSETGITESELSEEGNFDDEFAEKFVNFEKK